MGAPRWIVGVDTEFAVDDHTLVCVSLAWHALEGGAPVLHGVDLFHANDPAALAGMLRVLCDPEVLTVWMSSANDVTVCTLHWGREFFDAWWAAAQAGRVSDVYVREFLWWCMSPGMVDWFQAGSPHRYVPPTMEGKAWATSTQPSFGLASNLYRWTGEVLPKDDAVRMTYGPLRNVPLPLWDEAHEKYARDDAAAHVRTWHVQLTGRAVPGVRLITTRGGKDAKWPFSQHSFDNTARNMPAMAAVLRGEPQHRGPAGWLLPGEHKRILDALPVQWLCEPRNGSLFCDQPYAEMMRARYKLATDLLYPLLQAAGIFDAEGKKSLNVARQWAELLFNQMAGAWEPPLTRSGLMLRKAGTLAVHGSGDAGWRFWPRMWRDVASVGTKPLQECLVKLGNERAAPLSKRIAEGTATVEMIKAYVRGDWSGGVPHVPKLYAPVKVKPAPKPRKLSAKTIAKRAAIAAQATLFAPAVPVPAIPPPAPSEVPTSEQVRLVARALVVYAKANHTLKDSIMPALAAGRAAIVPTRYKPLITGRKSLEGAVLRQNKEVTGGSREVMIPAEGHLLFTADFSSIEALGFSLALQSAWEWKHNLPPGSYVSSLAKVLIAGKDPHIILGCRILKRSHPSHYGALEALCAKGYEGRTFSGEWALHDCYAAVRNDYKVMEKAMTNGTWLSERPASPAVRILGKLLNDKRDAEGKRLNFGLMGLMGPEKFIETQRIVGDYSWDLAKATLGCKEWGDQWYEAGAFRELVFHLAKVSGGAIRHSGCNRLRGGLSATQLANTLFQTPIAEMFYEAHREVWYEAHWVYESPLYGTNQVAPIHDEIVSTGPRHTLSPDLCPTAKCKHAPFSGCRTALARKQEVMVTVGRRWLPGLPVATTGAILERFAKA